MKKIAKIFLLSIAFIFFLFLGVRSSAKGIEVLSENCIGEDMSGFIGVLTIGLIFKIGHLLIKETSGFTTINKE